jgi:hypothetical protein
MLCCVLLFFSVVSPSCASTVLQYWQLQLYNLVCHAMILSSTIHQYACQLSPSLLSDNCTNTFTLTFIALRQLHCHCLLNCLVLWIHNPVRSMALRRRLPFLQKLITVTCKRFSTKQWSKPNHESNCVDSASLGVGWLTSVCDSHPFWRKLNFLSNSPCSYEVCNIKQ